MDKLELINHKRKQQRIIMQRAIEYYENNIMEVLEDGRIKNVSNTNEWNYLNALFRNEKCSQVDC